MWRGKKVERKRERDGGRQKKYKEGETERGRGGK